jgi:hypothetical protein
VETPFPERFTFLGRRHRLVVNIHCINGPFFDFDNLGRSSGESLQEIGWAWEIFVVRL